MKLPTMLALVLILTSAAAVAQEERANRFVRVYDVRELIHTIPNYEYDGRLSTQLARATLLGQGGGGGGGGGLFGGGTNDAAPEEQLTTAAQLIKLITETVVPTSWRENGGDLGSIRVLNGMLVITHNADGHKQVEELLRQLRDQQGRMVRVRAYWVQAGRAEIEALLVKETAGATVREVDVTALDSLRADAVRYAGETMCFSGQTVYVTVGRLDNVLSDLNPVVGQEAVAFDPTMDVLESGAVLQVTPKVQTDEKQATVDLHSVVADARREGELVLSAAGTVATTQPSGTMARGAVGGSVDRTSVLLHELHTTARIPLGKPVLIGGMSAEPSAGKDNQQQLVLIIQVISN